MPTVILLNKPQMGHGDADLGALAPGERTAPQPLPQRFPMQQLADGVGQAALDREIVNRHDVRMRQRGDGLGFALEADDRIGVAFQAARQDLDRHVAVQPAVAGAIHLAHAA